MLSWPLVDAEVTFLSGEEGGRQTPPRLDGFCQYCPQLVVQSPDTREAAKSDQYLGVAFVSGPERIEPGCPALCLLVLVYWPTVDYDALQPGAEFTIREGRSIVGFGLVRERVEPDWKGS